MCPNCGSIIDRDYWLNDDGEVGCCPICECEDIPNRMIPLFDENGDIAALVFE